MSKKEFRSAAEAFISSAAEDNGKQEEDKAAPKPRKKKTATAKTPAETSLNIPKGYKLTKESKSIRLQLLIRPTAKEAIKEIAAQQGLSMNDLINQILDEYIERQGNK